MDERPPEPPPTVSNAPRFDWSAPPAHSVDAQPAHFTDKLIPTRNPSALFGYYLGLFSCLPFLGLVMAVIGIWLGVKGLRAIREQPELPGKAHAWIGILCGFVGLAINIPLVVAMVLALLRS